MCSHGGLPLDAFQIFLGDSIVPKGEGEDVTTTSMSNIKEGKVATKHLWGESHLAGSVLMWEATFGTFAYTPPH